MYWGPPKKLEIPFFSFFTLTTGLDSSTPVAYNVRNKWMTLKIAPSYLYGVVGVSAAIAQLKYTLELGVH